MKSSLLLQLFLLADVFAMGMLASLAIRHGRAHRAEKTAHARTGSSPEDTAVLTNGELPAEVKQRMVQSAEGNFQNSLAATTAELEQNLAHTTEHINSLLNQVGTEVVGAELAQYRADLAAIREQAAAQLSGVSQAITDHEKQLRTELEQSIEAEKQRLITQLDTHLSDAVASFLSETLQHNVDLGAQTAYLTEMLHEHKAELIEGIKHVGR